MLQDEVREIQGAAKQHGVAAKALTAAVTIVPVEPHIPVEVRCEAPNLELLAKKQWRAPLESPKIRTKKTQKRTPSYDRNQ
jgi:hypothetical protein